jgi:hypothetical protein
MLNTVRNFDERRWRGTLPVLLLMLISHFEHYFIIAKEVGYMKSRSWITSDIGIQSAS